MYKKYFEFYDTATDPKDNYIFNCKCHNDNNSENLVDNCLWNNDEINASCKWSTKMYSNYGTKKYMYTANRDFSGTTRKAQKIKNNCEEIEKNRQGAKDIFFLSVPRLSMDVFSALSDHDETLKLHERDIELNKECDKWRYLRYARLYGKTPNCKIICLIINELKKLFIRLLYGCNICSYDFYWCDDTMIKYKPQYFLQVLSNRELTESAYFSYRPQHETSDVVEAQLEFSPDCDAYNTISRELGLCDENSDD